MSNHKLTFESSNLSFSFHNTGDIFQITHRETMINQWMSNLIDGSMNNIYLRIHQDNDIKYTPLIGIKSNSTVFKTDSNIIWKGSFENIQYQVIFHLTDKHIWFWDITLHGTDAEIDLIYGQDLGLADKGGIRTNEAYMSQYMDHSIYPDKNKGYVICTRQNQPMQGGYPYIQQGSLEKTVGYSTDGFQFFGLSYKSTNEPKVLGQPSLANENYQYEFAYTALQTEKVALNGKEQFVFYGLFKPSHPDAVTELEFDNDIQKAWESVQSTSIEGAQPIERTRISSNIGKPFQTTEMTEEELETFFPNRILEERSEEELLSFFTSTYEHIVLKKKEEIVERPHGHILMSGNNDKVQDNTFSTTVYMYGHFNSQPAIGNTNMNKMLTNARNSLNVPKTSGQRIYMEIDGVYRLLTMPSLFEIGFNYVRWYYKTENDIITITNFTIVDQPEAHLVVQSQREIAYKYLVTNQVTMNNNEYEVPYHINTEGNTITFCADKHSDNSATYPDLNYRIQVSDSDIEVVDETTLASNIESGDTSLVIFKVSATSEWSMQLQGSLNKDTKPLKSRDSITEIERYREFYRRVMRDFHVSQDTNDTEELEKVNALAWWYTHNMLVHFSIPHGLEQYSGAAWGTRDVCQGPSEYFLATQRYESVRDIIKTVFSHQYEDTGNWPQWFMFDKYLHLQQEDSHGDVIVWPLKLVSDYLEATKDYQILEVELPYTNRETFKFTKGSSSLLDHLQKEISYIKEHFLHDTHLSSYDDGDWDDTLQPANQNFKKYMVSSWTVALTYQVIKKMANVLGEINETESAKLAELAEEIKQDFNNYILQSDVIPGFLYMQDPCQPEMMLHPTDTKTEIDYRLLPMQRSIISELFTKKQAIQHYELIKEHLYCPDGVRLMNRPANYAGGVSTHFKRAEQASNFGREIGLQYAHAHIRFIEAMAKLGNEEDVWNGLAMINPIRIQDVVPNAEIRQSNAYFSSSDGKFNTRYDAQENFGKLRDGSVAVKGGWRIYSSGPGIYMNQLISNALGIRKLAGDLVIDPIIPERLNGLKLNFHVMELPVTFHYHLTKRKQQVVINGKEVTTEVTQNPYRDGGFIITEDVLKTLLNYQDNIIEIYL